MRSKKTVKSKVSKSKKQGLLKKAENINKIKIKKPFLTKLFVRIIIAVILLGLFAFGINFAVKKITQVSMEGKSAIVTKQLSYCQELVTAKYRYSDIVTLKKSAGFAKSYSIVKFSGILRVGIADITDVFYDISKDGKTVTLKMPSMEILGNDLVSQEVFDEKQSIFVPITTQEIFEEIEEARKQFEEDSIAEGILQEAAIYAEKIIFQMMKACGFEKVLFK